MKPHHFAVPIVSVLIAIFASTGRAADVAASPRTYVIVHGAWGAGYEWKEVGPRLQADGQEDGFFRFSERARARDWKVIEMEADHTPQFSRIPEIVELLETPQ